MNSILEEDIKNIADSKLVNWEEFNNKSILITGATGLICSIMIKAFCKKKLNLKMYLLVRNKENAKQMYGENENIEYIESSIENFNVEDIKVDYIIHAASPTKSKYVGGIAWGYGPEERLSREKMNSVEVDFEGIKVNTFACYDEYLTNLYGDYMKLPPKDKQIAHIMQVRKIENGEK